jgi:2-haloacid dehalogenase
VLVSVTIMPGPLRVRAILFDAYGTLFRLDSIEAACASALTPTGSGVSAAEFSGQWRAKQLEYSVHRSLMGDTHFRDFAAITEEALDYTLARNALTLTHEVRDALLGAWQSPGSDPQAAATLEALAGIPCAILSNGTPTMLQSAVTSAGISDHLQAILCASDARIYKPHPRVYALGPKQFGVLAEEMGFVTANGWDAAGAAAFGFQVCWVNRTGLPIEQHGPPPAAIVDRLDAVPDVFVGY